MKRLAGILVAILAPLAAYGQTLANQERGFSPDKTYQLGEVDSVNLLNGNVSLTIPVGSGYPVSAHFQYGLTLVYNSKAWDFELVDGQPRAVPNRVSNAGMGWQLSLGRLLAPTDPINDYLDYQWVYLGPDGGDHLPRATRARPSGRLGTFCSTTWHRAAEALRPRN